jgi:hypothetical protein
MDLKRVVDIAFETGGFGSGYLVTSRLVLTARHVSGDAQEGVACLVRGLPRSEGAARPEWSGRSVWLSSLDALLIELNEPVDDLPSDPIWFGRVVDKDRFEDVPCRGRGFPTAQRDGNARVDWPISGRLSWIVLGESRLGRFDIDRVQSPTDAELNLQGASGMAIFVGDTLVGVLKGGNKAWLGQKLAATVAAHLFDDAKFCELLAGSREAARRYLGALGVGPLGDAIRDHLHYIDRKPLVEALCQRLKSINRGGPVPPRLFMTRGVNLDRPSKFVERVAAELADRGLAPDAGADCAVPQLPWPERAALDDPKEEFDQLIASVLAKFDLRAASSKASDVRIAADRAGPIAFWWACRPNFAEAGHVELLRMWLDFWAETGAGSPVLMFVHIGQERPADNTAGSEAVRYLETLEAARAAGQMVGLGNYTPIESEDVPPWFSLIAKTRRDLSIQSMKSLQSRIEGRLPEPLPFSIFHQRLEETLGAQS